MHKAFLAILICCCFTAGAQEKQFEYADSSLIATTDTVVTSEELEEDVVSDILSDTTLYIHAMPVPADSILSLKRDKRFAYMKDIESRLRKLKEDTQGENKKSQNSSPSFLYRLLSSGAIKIFFWSVAILFVCFILYNLFLSKGVFKRKTATAPVEEIPEEEKEIAVSDYDQLIRQASGQGNYRLAVRYLFLKGIAMLAEKEYLHTAAGKTNYQYLQEIKPELRNDFSSLVLAYEYVWYGNFIPGKETYDSLEIKFKNFYRQIV